MPFSSFIVHILNLVVSFGLALWFARQGKDKLAWVIFATITLSAVLVQIWMLKEPAVILFGLFLIIGPAMLLPFPTFSLLVLGLVVIVTLISLSFAGALRPEWGDSVVLFAYTALGFGVVGAMVRRTIERLANVTVDMQEKAIEKTRLEQQLADLHHHVTTLATLEHDIRQPIHSIEGYLQFMQAAPNGIDTASLVTAARAANQRANRLVSNLLEVARSSIQQSQHKVQTIQGADILASIQAVTPGLARYYNEPPATVTFAIDGIPPAMALDVEQLQRAIFNLLDNALAHTPPEGAITVHSRLDGGDWSIAVQDTGPGIPTSVLQALHSDPSSGPPAPSGSHLGLGLRQVYATAAAHGGTVTIDSTPHGSTVQMRLPVVPGG
jgi:signal transduction histidine kinase